MQHELKDDQHKKYSKDSRSGVPLVVEAFINVMIPIFIRALCSPINDGEKYIDGTENMGINEMQDAYGHVTDGHFKEHQHGSQNIRIHD